MLDTDSSTYHLLSGPQLYQCTCGRGLLSRNTLWHCTLIMNSQQHQQQPVHISLEPKHTLPSGLSTWLLSKGTCLPKDLILLLCDTEQQQYVIIIAHIVMQISCIVFLAFRLVERGFQKLMRLLCLEIENILERDSVIESELC